MGGYGAAVVNTLTSIGAGMFGAAVGLLNFTTPATDETVKKDRIDLWKPEQMPNAL
jgi:mannose/fructose/N-acetylgalactosamine-specific phosphotransferase system component IIC